MDPEEPDDPEIPDLPELDDPEDFEVEPIELLLFACGDLEALDFEDEAEELDLEEGETGLFMSPFLF